MHGSENLLSENKSSLNSQVHDHESLGSQLIWQDFQSIGDEKTRPSEGIEDTEKPDPDDLDVSGGGILLVGLFVDGGGNGPGGEHENHTTC